MYSFFTFYGGLGGADDVFSQAVLEVKNELKIENNLEPAVLRAVYSKLYGNLETDKTDVKNTVTTYFVKSEEKEHTVTQEDINALNEQILQIQEQSNIRADKVDNLKKEDLPQTQANTLDKALNIEI